MTPKEITARAVGERSIWHDERQRIIDGLSAKERDAWYLLFGEWPKASFEGRRAIRAERGRAA